MWKVFFGAAAIAALLAGQAVAQSQTKEPSAKPVAADSSSNVKHQIEQHAAACLLIGNHEEIALSELGAEHAQSDEVKEFAREMIKEHTKLASRLRKFAPQQANFELHVSANHRAAPSGQRGEREQPTSVTESARPATGAAKPAAAGSLEEQLLAIRRDAAQHCLDMTSQDLKKKQGAEFDKAFMGVQCAAHTSMLAHLKALEGRTSGDFHELVTEAQQSTEKHLEHAKSIMKSLAMASPSRETREDRAPIRERREGDRREGGDAREDRDRRDATAPAVSPRGERAVPRSVLPR